MATRHNKSVAFCNSGNFQLVRLICTFVLLSTWQNQILVTAEYPGISIPATQGYNPMLPQNPPANMMPGNSQDPANWNLTAYLSELSSEIRQVEDDLVKPVKPQKPVKQGIKNFHKIGHFTTAKLGEEKQRKAR